MDTPLSKKVKHLLDTFGPLVEALPEVLIILEEEQKGKRRLDQLKADIQHESGRLDVIQRKLAEALSGQEEAMNQRVQDYAEMERKGQMEFKELVQKRKVAARKLNEVSRELERARADADKQIENIQMEVEAQCQAAEAAAQLRLLAVEDSIKEAEKRYGDTVKKLERLKSSLG